MNTMTTGNISPVNKISGNITYGNGNGEYVPLYVGDYTVTPQAFEEVILETNGKKMTKNVTVKEIPYFETTNTSGGVTVYIAGQIEFE